MARQALPPSSLSFSDASLFPGSTARERPEDGTSTAHYDALNYRVGPAREKTSAHLLVIRQVILETRTPGQREERKKKKKKPRRRPLQPQVQVESSRSRPPGTRLDQVAYVAPALGCLIGERLCAPLRSRTPGRRNGGREIKAAGGRRWTKVVAVLPQALPQFFSFTLRFSGCGHSAPGISSFVTLRQNIAELQAPRVERL